MRVYFHTCNYSVHVCLCVLYYVQAEVMFSRLLAASSQFEQWVVLGSVDLNALVEHQCQTVSDWENNFKALKNRGKEAEKLPK